MNYLVVQTSGRQFLMKHDEWYDVDFIRQSSVGDHISLHKPLLFKKEKRLQIGKPFLKTKISAKIIDQVQGPKVVVLKTKAKKRYTRKRGHRQKYTRIQLDLNS